MSDKPSRFALYFGTRDVFPGSLIASARQELSAALQARGHEVIMLDIAATNHGAVETRREGEVFAQFLRDRRADYDGVILALPNFGDENGALAAFAGVDVPVLMLAWPDRLDEMAPGHRRDAFCGKLSVMDVFCQADIPFTALTPHTVAPGSQAFAHNIEYFDRLCRVVAGMRRLRIGALGARVTPFKTVRIDETALQKRAVTVESYDLSDVFERMRQVSQEQIRDQITSMESFTDLSAVPADAQEKLARLAEAMDQIITQDSLDAVALRCWFEIQSQWNISPCVLLAALNHRGIPAACEVDVGNAVVMKALQLAAGSPSACLDWNNNYEDDPDKCILFHCGPVPPELMAGRGRVTDHDLIATVLGKDKSFGCNVGRIAPGPFTFSSLMTRDGVAELYLGEGTFTDDAIPSEFFGCAGVAHIPHLQDVLLHVGLRGHRHHVSIVAGRYCTPLAEALEKYLGYSVAIPQPTVPGGVTA